MSMECVMNNLKAEKYGLTNRSFFYNCYCHKRSRWKGGEIPPLPRSREGNESPKSHSRDGIVRGGRASRRPEAGKPVHLELERINFKYGEKRVLQDVTLTVEKGEFFGILGPNGSRPFFFNSQKPGDRQGR